MPRLTRTAKYADLRNQLLSDKEEYTKSDDLSSYQNKLDNVKNNLVSDEEAKQNYWKNYQEQTYFQDPASEDPIYQELLKKDFGDNPFMKSVEEAVTAKNFTDNETTIIENPAVEEVLIEEQQPEIVEEKIENQEPIIEEAIIEGTDFEEPVEFDEISVEEQQPEIVEEVLIEEQQPEIVQEVLIEEQQPEIKEETVEEDTPNKSFFDTFIDVDSQDRGIGENFSSYFDSKEDENIFYDNMYTNVFKDVKDESGEIVNLKERETYLNQTISDVNTYNEEIGEETINTAIENLIDEIRHPEKAYEEPVVEEKVENNDYLDTDSLLENNIKEDELFNSTVSLEISKIMDEVAGVSTGEYMFDEEYNEPEEVQLDADDVINDNHDTVELDEPQPEDNNEEVVEIKNIAEIEKEEMNTISQTIPFIVADSQDLLDEEDDDEGSNVVLNIILIVLIIVLVAVLGLIVFYILKTKGIL